MRSKVAIKNSLAGIASQIINMFFSFISRTLFIKYLGVDILGINGVVSNILGMLSLAELGVGVAITYNLYKPLVDKDKNIIASLMMMYKKIYNIIGCIVLVLGLILMLTLKYIINDPGISLNFINLIYLIQLLSTVSTYFLGFKRTLLSADQKQYICIIYDSVINIISHIIKIIVLILFKSYIVYLIIQLAQNILSNIFISYECNKRYPYINSKKIKKYENTKGLFNNTKDILFARIAGYVYSSTDNIVISNMIGVSYVGLLANYTFIINIVKTIIYSILNPIQYIIGNYVNSNEDKENQMYILGTYTFIRFIIISICVTPLIVLTQPFIQLWLGSKYVLSSNIVILMSVDLIINILHAPLVEYRNGLGLFKDEKYISICGALINLVISIVFVKTIGIEGVLVGTVISQLFFWIARSGMLFKKHFSGRGLIYLKEVITYLIICILQVVITMVMLRNLLKELSIGIFIIGGIIAILVPIIINIVVFHKNKYFRDLYNRAKKMIKTT